MQDVSDDNDILSGMMPYLGIVLYSFIHTANTFVWHFALKSLVFSFRSFLVLVIRWKPCGSPPQPSADKHCGLVVSVSTLPQWTAIGTRGKSSRHPQGSGKRRVGGVLSRAGAAWQDSASGVVVFLGSGPPSSLDLLLQNLHLVDPFQQG